MAYLTTQDSSFHFESKIVSIIVTLVFCEEFHDLCFVILCDLMGRTIGAKVVRSAHKGDSWAVQEREGGAEECGFI